MAPEYKHLCQVSLVCLTMLYVLSGQAATISANSSVTIVKPMALTKTADLVFGSLAPTKKAGTVTMSPAGIRTSKDVILSPTATGHAATFNLTGIANAIFSIILPHSTTLTGPGASMKVSAFTSTPSQRRPVTFNRNGTATLAIGAKLAVGANQTPGTYTGIFSITVNYN